jgi:hypothetical protein
MQVAGRQILRAWPRLGIVALLVVVGFGAADVLAPARPASEPATHVGSIELAGRHIPLPEGVWLEAGSSNDSAGPAETRPYGAIETVVLFKLVDRAVDSFITIRANSLPIEGGRGTAVECGRDDIHFVSVFYLSAHESLCGFVNHVMTARAAGSSPAWVEALQLARVRGWALPETWLMAGFRITNRHDTLDLRYHLNPERGGFPPIGLSGRTAFGRAIQWLKRHRAKRSSTHWRDGSRRPAGRCSRSAPGGKKHFCRRCPPSNTRRRRAQALRLSRNPRPGASPRSRWACGRSSSKPMPLFSIFSTPLPRRSMPEF